MLASDLAVFVLTYCVVLLIGWPLHGYGRANKLAWLEACASPQLDIQYPSLLVAIEEVAICIYHHKSLRKTIGYLL